MIRLEFQYTPEDLASVDETAWLLTCSDGRYRVKFMGDASVEVERLP